MAKDTVHDSPMGKGQKKKGCGVCYAGPCPMAAALYPRVCTTVGVKEAGAQMFDGLPAPGPSPAGKQVRPVP